MARFNFGKRSSDEEGVTPEPIEGETEVGSPSDFRESGSRLRRPLIFAGIGVLLIGGLYLANILFFSAPPPPPIPTRPTVPAPAATVPAPPAQTKGTPPGSPSTPPSKPEAKAEAKGAAPLAAPPSPAPAKVVPPMKAAPEPAPPAKVASEPTAPAKAAPVTKPVPPPATAEKKAPAQGVAPSAKGFTLQVGAMAQQANAEKLKQKLDAMGYQAVVRKGSGSANRHVVTVGEPTGKAEAEALSRRLNVDGFPSQLVSLEGKYAPQVGAFVNLDEAIDVARELQKKDYRPKITSKPATTVLFHVRHGQFDTRAAAVKRGEELKAKGFSAWVVPN